MNHRKLTIYDRIRLQAGLEQRLPIQEIAHDLNVHRSSIYRELVLHRTFHRASYNGNLCDIKEAMIVCNRCPKYAKCHCAQWVYDFQDAQREAENDRSFTRHHSRLSQDIIDRIDYLVTPGIRHGQSLHHVYVSIPELSHLCNEQTIRRLCYANRLSFKAHELRRYVSYKHHHRLSVSPLPTRNVALLMNRTYADFTSYVKTHPSVMVVEFDSLLAK